MGGLLGRGNGRPPQADRRAGSTTDLETATGAGADSAPRAGDSRLGTFDPEDGEQPTAEEQAAYNRFVGNALLLMSNEEVTPALLRTIGTADDPAAGVGEAAASVFLRVEAAADEQGIEIPGDVAFQGGVEIVENVADIALAAGIADLDDDELERALLTGLDTVREVKAQRGDLDQEAAQADLRRLAEAEQAGRLDQVLPGIEGAAQRAQEQQQAAQRRQQQAAQRRQQQAAQGSGSQQAPGLTPDGAPPPDASQKGKPRRRGKRGGRRLRRTQA